VSCYGRIERGYMASDHFTQVSNELARDRRLSRKARGLFLEIASRRDGYGLTVEALVRSGPEGRDAIMTRLKELERHGYLERHQERDERGRLGTAVYRITDSPKRPATIGAGAKSHRSAPKSENPTTGKPTSADRQPKKTKIKKTSQQKTTPSPPFPAPSPGVSLLLEIGTRDARLGIGGEALHRQAKRLDTLLADGWDADALRAALTGGLPTHITSPAGFLACRISHIPAAPVTLPAQTVGSRDGTTYTPPPFGQHIVTPALPECDECGRPPVPGYDRCAACMDWPYCSGCERRPVPPNGTGRCGTCDEATVDVAFGGSS
jgi:hypothetical protein